jgi:hypothetical protein
MHLGATPLSIHSTHPATGIEHVPANAGSTLAFADREHLDALQGRAGMDD